MRRVLQWSATSVLVVFNLALLVLWLLSDARECRAAGGVYVVKPFAAAQCNMTNG